MKLHKASFLLLATADATTAKLIHSNNNNKNDYPCIQRSNYRIRAMIPNDQRQSAFYQGAQQASEDLGIQLSFETYDEAYDLADAIDCAAQTDHCKLQTALASSSSLRGGLRNEKEHYGRNIENHQQLAADALIVSIPSDENVRDAIKRSSDSGMPIFAIGSFSTDGHYSEDDLGIITSIATSHYEEGRLSADAFLRDMDDSFPPEALSFLFLDKNGGSINHQRQQGFFDALSDGGLNSTTTVRTVSSNDNDTTTDSLFLDSWFEGCPYDGVILSSAHYDVQDVIKSSKAKNCHSTTMLGVFHDNDDGLHVIYDDMLESGDLSFVISSQEYLQGALATILATHYVTTGQQLEPPIETNGTYLTGSNVQYKKKNSVVGSNDIMAAAEDRSDIVIGGVTHGVTSDVFWDQVNAAFAQGARDMGITLKFEPFESSELVSEDLFDLMSERIRHYCLEDKVDGLFVTLPNEDILPAIHECRSKGIPVDVISLNSGIDIAKDENIQYLGQNEYQAGFQAGVRMADQANEFYCLHHARGVTVVNERCNGFRDGLFSRNVTAYTNVFVEPTDPELFRATVEQAVNRDDEDDWSGVGLLLAGQPNHIPGIDLLMDHPGAKAGAIDVSEALYQALEDDLLLFGVDQQPYLQGYLALPLLTYKAWIDQGLLNPLLSTGPAFVDSYSSTDKHGFTRDSQTNNYFEVC